MQFNPSGAVCTIKSEEKSVKEMLYTANIYSKWFIVHKCDRIILASNHPDPLYFPTLSESVPGRVKKGLYVTMPGWLSLF